MIGYACYHCDTQMGPCVERLIVARTDFRKPTSTLVNLATVATRVFHHPDGALVDMADWVPTRSGLKQKGVTV